MHQDILKKRELSVETKAAIVRAVCEILDDPDFGLDLSAAARRRLQKARRSHGKGASLSAIKERYA